MALFWFKSKAHQDKEVLDKDQIIENAQKLENAVKTIQTSIEEVESEIDYKRPETKAANDRLKVSLKNIRDQSQLIKEYAPQVNKLQDLFAGSVTRRMREFNRSGTLWALCIGLTAILAGSLRFSIPINIFSKPQIPILKDSIDVAVDDLFEDYTSLEELRKMVVCAIQNDTAIDFTAARERYRDIIQRKLLRGQEEIIMEAFVRALQGKYQIALAKTEAVTEDRFKNDIALLITFCNNRKGEYENIPDFEYYPNIGTWFGFEKAYTEQFFNSIKDKRRISKNANTRIVILDASEGSPSKEFRTKQAELLSMIFACTKWKNISFSHFEYKKYPSFGSNTKLLMSAIICNDNELKKDITKIIEKYATPFAAVAEFNPTKESFLNLPKLQNADCVILVGAEFGGKYADVVSVDVKKRIATKTLCN